MDRHARKYELSLYLETSLDAIVALDLILFVYDHGSIALVLTAHVTRHTRSNHTHQYHAESPQPSSGTVVIVEQASGPQSTSWISSQIFDMRDE